MNVCSELFQGMFSSWHLTFDPALSVLDDPAMSFATILSVTQFVSSTIFWVFRAIWAPLRTISGSITLGPTPRATDSETSDTYATPTQKNVSYDIPFL